MLYSLFLYPTMSFSGVYDCFTFFNEVDLLELRFNELYDYVDKFVIVEAEEGFSGPHHDFVFEKIQNQERFSKFLDKVVYIKVMSPIKSPSQHVWHRENFIKNQVMRGLKNCNPDDLILFSDADEFPPRDMVPKLAEAIKTTPIIVTLQNCYRYYLNRYASKWMGTIAIRYDLLTDGPVSYRKHHPNGYRSHICFSGHREIDGITVPVWEGGWHFTKMEGFDKYLEKIQNYTHFDQPHPDTPQEYKYSIEHYGLVPIDTTYPTFVLENIDYLTDIGLIQKISN